MDVGAGLDMYDVVVKKFTFAISSPDEFLVIFTLIPLFSTLFFHSLSLLIKSSSVSAITTKSSAYNSSLPYF